MARPIDPAAGLTPSRLSLRPRPGQEFFHRLWQVSGSTKRLGEFACGLVTVDELIWDAPPLLKSLGMRPGVTRSKARAIAERLGLTIKHVRAYREEERLRSKKSGDARPARRDAERSEGRQRPPRRADMPHAVCERCGHATVVVLR